MPRFAKRWFNQTCTVELRRGDPSAIGKPTVTGSAVYPCRIERNKRLTRTGDAGEVRFGDRFFVAGTATVETQDRIAVGGTPNPAPVEADYREILTVTPQTGRHGDTDHIVVEVGP
jgi:hypothetical protein